MKRNWTIAVSLSVVFVCGMAVGALGHWLYSNNTVSATTNTPPRTAEEFRKRYVAEMRGRLRLDDGQVQQLNLVLDETRAKMQAMKERHKPEVRVIQQEQVDRINGFLNEGQRAEYSKMRQEREDRAKKKEASGGGGC